METREFFIISLGFIALTSICLFSIIWAIKKISKSKKSTYYSLILLCSWLLFTSVLALVGFIRNFTLFPFNVMVILLPPLITLIILVSNKRFGIFLQQVPIAWMIGIQIFRIPVELFLWWLFEIQLLPIQMTFEGRNFDIFVGITAPFVAYFFTQNRQFLIWWNIGGMVLLINIVGTAMLSMPTPFRVFMNEPANVIVTYFPIIWLPTFLVPLAYYMHILSLKQLLNRKAK